MKEEVTSVKRDVVSVKANLDSLNKGVATLSQGVNFLLQGQGLTNPLHGLQGSTTLSGMLLTSSKPFQIPNFISGSFQMLLNVSPTLTSHQIPSISAGVLGEEEALDLAVSPQTLPSTSAARVPMRQSLGGQQTHTGVPASLRGEESLAATSHQTVASSQQTVNSILATRVSASAVLSSLEESSEGDLLFRSDLTSIFMKSCSRKNMVILMTRRLFSECLQMFPGAVRSKNHRFHLQESFLVFS